MEGDFFELIEVKEYNYERINNLGGTLTPIGFGTVLLLTSTEHDTELDYDKVRINASKARAILEWRRHNFYVRCLGALEELNSILEGLKTPDMSQDAYDETVRTFDGMKDIFRVLKHNIITKMPILPDTGIADDFDKWAEEINRYDQETSDQLKVAIVLLSPYLEMLPAVK